MFDKETQKQKAANESLITAAKRRDVEGIRNALETGADPNCFISTKAGRVRVYDYLNNLKGKNGKDALDVLYRFGGRSEKNYAQRKKIRSTRITMTAAKRMKQERIRQRIREKEAARQKGC